MHIFYINIRNLRNVNQANLALRQLDKCAKIGDTCNFTLYNCTYFK